MVTKWRVSYTWIAGALALAACGGPNTPTPDGGGNDTGPADTLVADGADAIITTDTVVPTDVPTADVQPGTARAAQTNGSAIALSGDDHVAVGANRTANSISVFNVGLTGTPATVSRTTQLPTGPNSHPWAVVIGNDNDTAYAILRGTREVIKITHLSTAPAIDAQRATTGSEPTGIAITPTGTRLYVANWTEGTISIVNTADMSSAGTVDLNAALSGSGLIGTAAPAAGRPGLAHPRSLVITNNGDGNDADETVYVTEFFAQARTTGVPTDDSQWDQNRQGVVYRFNVGTGTVAAPILLAPIANTGFQDTNGANAGCFPNQLYGIALNNNRVYVSSVCASPRGPTGPGTGTTVANNFKTEVFALLSVIDTATNTETPGEAVLMTQRWQAAYDTAAAPDDGTRRMPLIVNDLAFLPASHVLYATAYGSDAVFRVAFGADGTVSSVGSTMNMFINLNPGGTIPVGQLPIGLAVSNSGQPFAITLNENSRNTSLIDFRQQVVVSGTVSADPPTTPADIQVNDGRRFFVTGLARWSLRGQGWNSCEGCHNDGLTDNVTWFFARGPRQTTSLDGTYAPDGVTQRFLNWTAIQDEVHDFELNTRGNSGGVGAIVHANSAPPAAADRIIFDGTAVVAGQTATTDPQNGLNGSVVAMVPPNTGVPQAGGGTAVSVHDDWARIDAFVKTIAPPHAPVALQQGTLHDDVVAGAALFNDNGCASCHGGPDWTISRRFYTPGATANSVTAIPGSLRAGTYALPAGFAAALNPAAAIGRMATLRYLPTDAADGAANDQINCVLRAVGTFPASPNANNDGVSPTGVPVREVRTNMMTRSQGATGYNPPSLIGMATGAPYFHAGNARTLEEAFSTTFATHYTAQSANFLSTGDVPLQIRQITAFLLSIDESPNTTPVSIQGTLTFNPDLCPITF